MKILFFINDLLTIPLSILYLSAVSRQAGHQSVLAVRQFEDPEKAVRKHKPEVFVFSIISGAHHTFIQINRRLKEKFEIPSLFGGPHCTFFPDFLYQEPDIDAICLGEGEEALVEMLYAMQNNLEKRFLKNWWVRQDGEIYKNPLRPLCEDLDALPFPDLDLLEPFAKWRDHKTAFVITSRDCPFHCSYCFNHAFRKLYGVTGSFIRRRSVENVIRELKELKARQPLEMVIFQDDTFILKPEWVEEFCQRYKEEIDLPFHCHLRANLVTKKMAQLLKSAGCYSVKMAIETAEDRLRNDILKRGISKNQLVRACRAVQEAGIRLLTQNILAIPTGGLSEDIETLKFNLQIKPDYLFVTLLQAYPGTEIGDFAKEKGLYEGNPEALPGSFFHRSELKIQNKKQIQRLRMLFPLVVEWQWLYKLLPVLIRLPLGNIYLLLDKLWKGYCIKHRIYPYKLTWKEYLRSVWIYLRANYY